MKFTYDPNLYELTDGRYLAQFMKVEDFDKSQLRNDPYPNSGPMVRWTFVICSGEDRGKEGHVLTPKHPTKKNACTRMISGIIGHPLAEHESVDMDSYKGNYYAISVVDGRISHQFPPQPMGVEYESARKTWMTMNPGQELAPDKDENIPF